MTFISRSTITNPIPPETKIYYNKTDAFFKLLLLLFGLAAGLWFLINNIFIIDVVICAVIIAGCLFAVSAIYGKIKILLNNIPRIIINYEGIQTAATPFYSWPQIKDEQVVSELLGNSNYYLVYKCPGGEVSTKMNLLNITKQDMITLLRFYRHGHENGIR